MSGIGHNGGPSMEAGYGFRKVAWKKARASLLPTLPLEIVRVRVARAKRLGLPYKTYATIRATSGHDIVAFLFSGNALGLPRRAPCPRRTGPCGSSARRRGGAAGGGLCAAPPRDGVARCALPRRGGGRADDPDYVGRSGRAPARVRARAGAAAGWRRAGLGHGAGARLVRGRGAGRKPERRGVFRGPRNRRAFSPAGGWSICATTDARKVPDDGAVRNPRTRGAGLVRRDFLGRGDHRGCAQRADVHPRRSRGPGERGRPGDPGAMGDAGCDQLHGDPWAGPDLPVDDLGADRTAGPAADVDEQLLAPRDGLHDVDRGAGGCDDGHFRRRPGADGAGGDRRLQGGADIATPGHVFPLRARDGGVLVRAGHTEAAVDISRLAG
jgi:hypothetical protein